jgi:endonuclease III
VAKKPPARLHRILERLAATYPDARCSLTYRHPFELLVATILSAQCTDERVNAVTPALFARFPTAQAMASAERTEIEKLIHSCGFYRNKAKSLQESSRLLVERFGGEVPRSMEAMLQLPGVARKTASVVLGNAYGLLEGIAVDTHVFRVARRLDMTHAKTPEQVERDLMEQVPRGEWLHLNHRLIEHGRAVCTARKPRCEACVLAPDCPRVGVEEPGA